MQSSWLFLANCSSIVVSNSSSSAHIYFDETPIWAIICVFLTWCWFILHDLSQFSPGAVYMCTLTTLTKFCCPWNDESWNALLVIMGRQEQQYIQPQTVPLSQQNYSLWDCANFLVSDLFRWNCLRTGQQGLHNKCQTLHHKPGRVSVSMRSSLQFANWR